MKDKFRNKKPDDPKDDSNEGWLSKLSNPSTILWIVAAIMLGAVLWNLLSTSQPSTERLTYTEFRNQVRSGNVDHIVISGNRIEGVLDTPIQQTAPSGGILNSKNFVTYLPSIQDNGLFTLLDEHNVQVEAQPSGSISWGSALMTFLPLLLFGGLLLLFFRRRPLQGGEEAMSMTKSRARRYTPSAEQVTFDDVAGASGPKLELQEVVEFLKFPERFQSLGAKIPKGVLLVGPPGTGKTLLARAVAGEASVPFFSLSGSDFMEVFVGVGASRVRDLFQQAKESSPAIIFIDELDSIGRKRGAGIGGGQDEREQTLNQLLSEMDGFEPNQHVIVMAATNRPDILDPALERPGRFDRQVMVDTPTLNERVEILGIHARQKPLAADVDLERVARTTPGFSGADLANLLNEAALLAARRKKTEIGNDEIGDSRDKVLMGLERNLVLNEEEARLIAYHEGGHAVVAAVLPYADPIDKVTIIPRGRAMGVTQQVPERDRFLYPREYLLDRMAVMMGGRAAEELALGTMTTGASDDLKQATRLARKMVLDWGMSDLVGHVALSDESENSFLGDEFGSRRGYSETTAREVDEEVRRVLEEAHGRAVQVLQDHRDGLDHVVAALVEKEQIMGAELLQILNVERKAEGIL